MSILFLLLLIPLYLIALVFNIGTLVNIIINNEVNFVYFAISIVVIYFLGIIILHLLGKCFNDVPKIRNLDGEEFALTSTVIITINFLFAMCIYAQTIIYELNVVNIIIASAILVIYVFYMVALKRQHKLVTYKLISVDTKHKLYDELLFEGKDNSLYEFSVNKKHSYLEDRSYLCKASSRRIYKIIKEVIDID